jgi:IS1 family transposase
MKDYEDDGPWMWVAFAPGCRLVLDFVIGPRKQYVADKLVKSVKNIFRIKSLFLSQMD